jgi:RimJ/RimL family protein N-acetyltransferase
LAVRTVKETQSRQTNAVRLRDVVASDLPVFYEHQRDPAANFMAAFTAKDPADRAAFDAHWKKLLDNDAIIKRTVLVDGQVAGNVASFEQMGDREVTYWLGRSFWGRGVATAALEQLLEVESVRPLYARVAKDNLASIRVLEKCKFTIIGEDRGFANARGQEIEEYILQLSM